nr:thioredoxin domain-containing protein [Angustibacter aerolatus]
MVVGGGDSAMEEATFLTKFARLGDDRAPPRRACGPRRSCRTARWPTRRSGSRGTPRSPSLRGDPKLDEIVLRDTRTGELRTMAVGGLFVAVGHDPRTDLFKDQVALNEHGFVAVEGRRLADVARRRVRVRRRGRPRVHAGHHGGRLGLRRRARRRALPGRPRRRPGARPRGGARRGRRLTASRAHRPLSDPSGTLTPASSPAVPVRPHASRGATVATRSITDDTFDTEVLQSDKPVLVDFWAPWCHPCKAMAPILDEIAGEHAEIDVVKINTDDHPKAAARYGVTGLPTLNVYVKGEPGQVDHRRQAQARHDPRARRLPGLGTTPVSTPPLRRGDRGTAVEAVRERLVATGDLRATDSDDPSADLFDADVERAVRSFQQRRGMLVDGVVGKHTYRALDGTRWMLGDRILVHTPGHLVTGDDVAALQERLLGLGLRCGLVDGVFGPLTDDALREPAAGCGSAARRAGRAADAAGAGTADPVGRRRCAARAPRGRSRPIGRPQPRRPRRRGRPRTRRARRGCRRARARRGVDRARPRTARRGSAGGRRGAGRAHPRAARRPRHRRACRPRQRGGRRPRAVAARRAPPRRTAGARGGDVLLRRRRPQRRVVGGR